MAVRTVARSPVTHNAASLYGIQFAGYLLPIVTVPYLVRVLGPGGYGAVAFGRSLIGVFILFVDYGFAWSATRKVSLERDNLSTVSLTAFGVWGAKAVLCCVGLVVLLILTALIPKLHAATTLLLIMYGIVIGNVLFPVWLFQGMEKMVHITAINLTAQLIVTIGVFTLIRHPEDYIAYAGLISAGSLTAGLVGAGLALRLFKLQVIIPSARDIWKHLVEGWTIFISMASVSLYTVANAFILGMLTNSIVVGYYSAAEGLVKVAVSLTGPISQAVYPRFSRIASQSKQLTLYWGRRMLLVMSSLGATFSIVLFVGAPWIVQTILGSGYESSIPVMRILAPLPFLISVSNVLGVQIMFPLRMERAVAIIVLCAGAINVGLAVLLAPVWLAVGMAVAVLISETFVTTSQLSWLTITGLSPLQELGKTRRERASSEE